MDDAQALRGEPSGAHPRPRFTLCSARAREDSRTPMSTAYTIGIDYGTNSVRAVVVKSGDGSVVGPRVFDYPSGDRGVLLDPRQPHLARQNPADYIEGLRVAVAGALDEA